LQIFIYIQRVRVVMLLTVSLTGGVESAVGYYANMNGENIPLVDDDVEMTADDFEQEGRAGQVRSTGPDAAPSSTSASDSSAATAVVGSAQFVMNMGGFVVVAVAVVAIVMMGFPQIIPERFRTNR
jgi:hypothetical protein